MSSQVCVGCGETIDKQPKMFAGQPTCGKPRCAGIALASMAKYRKLEGSLDKSVFDGVGKLKVVPPTPTPTGFILSPDDKTKPSKTPGWGRVELNRNLYAAHEVTVMVKVSEDQEWRVFGTMKNVYAYTDPKSGVLLRPNAGGVRETFKDIPRALRTARTALYRRHGGKAPAKPAKAPEGSEKRGRPITTVSGATYGNPCQAPNTKRFYLVESMLKGGTPKEIVDRADQEYSRLGYGPRGELSRTIPSNPRNIENMYKWLTTKWNKFGVRHHIQEKNGLWTVEVLP